MAQSLQSASDIPPVASRPGLAEPGSGLVSRAPSQLDPQPAAGAASGMEAIGVARESRSNSLPAWACDGPLDAGRPMGAKSGQIP